MGCRVREVKRESVLLIMVTAYVSWTAVLCLGVLVMWSVVKRGPPLA